MRDILYQAQNPNLKYPDSNHNFNSYESYHHGGGIVAIIVIITAVIVIVTIIIVVVCTEMRHMSGG